MITTSPMSFDERVRLFVPPEFPIQKLKTRGKLPEHAMQIDWVVRSPAALPERVREIGIVKIKGDQLDVEALLQRPLHVRTLVIHKSVTLSPTQIERLRCGWGVDQIFDFRDKSQKKILKAALKGCKENREPGLNKVVINPDSKLEKKAKVVCSEASLGQAVALISGAGLLSQVTSLKCAKVNFRAMPETCACILALPSAIKVKFKKSDVTPEQEAAYVARMSATQGA